MLQSLLLLVFMNFIFLVVVVVVVIVNSTFRFPVLSKMSTKTLPQTFIEILNTMERKNLPNLCDLTTKFFDIFLLFGLLMVSNISAPIIIIVGTESI